MIIFSTTISPNLHPMVGSSTLLLDQVVSASSPVIRKVPVFTDPCGTVQCEKCFLGVAAMMMKRRGMCLWLGTSTRGMNRLALMLLE